MLGEHTPAAGHDNMRDPCPWVILNDFGGAFSMGCIGGAIWHGIKGARNSPRGELRAPFIPCQMAPPMQPMEKAPPKSFKMTHGHGSRILSCPAAGVCSPNIVASMQPTSDYREWCGKQIKYIYASSIVCEDVSYRSVSYTHLTLPTKRIV